MLLIGAAGAWPASAQDSGDPPAESDHGQAGRRPDLGGPTIPGNQIERDRDKELKLYRFPFLRPYYDWKDELSDRYGFSFGVDYIVAGLYSNDTLPGTDENAYGGVVRAFGTWELLGRGSEAPGTLNWRVTNGHSYTDNTAFDFSLSNLGNVSVIDPLHDDAGTKLGNLFWRQSLNGGDVQVIGGFFDTADLIEFYHMTDPFTSFRNLAFLTGMGTIPLPSAGALGFVGAAWLNDQVYVSGGVVDSNPDPRNPQDGFDTFFNDHEYFTFVEVGWTTSPDKVYQDNIHVTAWHVDERDDAGTEEGHGAVFSYARYFEETYLPFLKMGWAEDGSSLLETSVSMGVGYQPTPIEGVGNLLGVGLHWGEPNATVFGSGLDDQYSSEVFYRWQVSKEVALTPNVQLLINPALHPEEDSIWVLGVRARFAF